MSIFLLLILAILPSLNAQECNLQGRCLDGSLLNANVVASRNKCQDFCEETKDCQFFTFNAEDNFFCELYDKCDLTSGFGCKTCVSNEVTCDIEAENRCFVNGLCKVILKPTEGSETIRGLL